MAIKKVTNTSTIDVKTCDICGSEAVPYHNPVMKCQICGIDVCGNCAIKTDHWCLEDLHFSGDYPDYYCKNCWFLGEDILKRIENCRDDEGKLWIEWRRLAKEGKGGS